MLHCVILYCAFCSPVGKLHLCRQERGCISKDEIQEITAKSKKPEQGNAGLNLPPSMLLVNVIFWSILFGKPKVVHVHACMYTMFPDIGALHVKVPLSLNFALLSSP